MKKTPDNKIWTTSLEPLVVETANAKRSLEIEISSIEQDNEKMLHFLFEKTRAPNKENTNT